MPNKSLQSYNWNWNKEEDIVEGDLVAQRSKLDGKWILYEGYESEQKTNISLPQERNEGLSILARLAIIAITLVVAVYLFINIFSVITPPVCPIVGYRQELNGTITEIHSCE